MHKILLVDDTKIVHQLVRIYLSGLGAEFDDAHCGKEGAAKIAANHYDLVICDLAMQDLDGLEICKLVRADARTKELPFVLLTSQTDPEYRLAAVRLGVTEFLNKPIDGKQLARVVRDVLKLGPETPG